MPKTMMTMKERMKRYLMRITRMNLDMLLIISRCAFARREKERGNYKN
jgi:hypothetical protein